ncbi:MAG: hypothetical protein ACLP2P_00375 [Desulfobaccales bacterium]
MEKNNYKYDVAFSFLDQDEPLAIELNDLLQDRLTTFLYSERQKEIAGKDGEKIFAEVFGEEARVVVVLYRGGWGKTLWTRIEENAIRNRAFEQGYDFTIFIPLDDIPSMPKWVPKNRLWVGLKRWGANGAASAIEASVQERDGEPHEENAIERATRLKRSLEFEEKRKEFRYSFEGVRIANLELEKLKKEIISLIDKINRSDSGIELQSINSSYREIIVSSLGFWLKGQWKCGYNNSLDNSELYLTIWDGDPSLSYIIRGMPLNKLGEDKFNFDMVPTGDYRWIASSSGRSFSSKDLSSYIIKYFLDKIQKA